MTKIRFVVGIIAAGALALSVSAFAGTNATVKKGTTKVAAKTETKTAMKWDDEKGLREHVTKHMTYPITKADMMKACNDMKDVTANDKKMFEAKMSSIPADHKFMKAEEVMSTLGMK